MSAKALAGFIVVGVIAVAGVDYHTQSKKADSALSVQQYADTFQERFLSARVERKLAQAERAREKRWKAGAKPYLPASSAEWVRRAIAERDFTVDARTGPEQAKLSEAARPLAIKAAVQEATVQAKKLDRNSWVYEKDGHTIWLHASLSKGANTNTLAGNLAQSIAAMDFGGKDPVPLGVIGGVAYFQAVQEEYYDVPKVARSNWALIKPAPAETDVQVSFDTYTGKIGIGEEIRLLVRSDAPRDEVRIFLGQVDYDGLNALLSRPVPMVGNATQVEPANEIRLAEQMAGLRSEFVKLRGELAQMRIDNLDGLALAANTLAGQYGLPNDRFDLTANRIATPNDLIQFGYREGLSDLMGPKTEKASADDGDLFGRLFAKLKSNASTKAQPEQGSDGFIGGSKPLSGHTESAEAPTVRVNKGGAGAGSGCSTKGAFKRCSLSGG
ncbi:hypothetical protein M3P21_21740 [Ruegeria sp. 2012CJ41-6]|uniref:DUF945 domain-containing protein n=1 Tax=Ruegeria spongiae TaxID=2942209 RepID=A0ABT0Q8C9_9RHOB|nr:hypothetical protein [Ruegeria spongiae]MCL6286133.1 hypothetical protein [Ruegeria spongiae]